MFALQIWRSGSKLQLVIMSTLILTLTATQIESPLNAGTNSSLSRVAASTVTLTIYSDYLSLSLPGMPIWWSAVWQSRPQ